MKMFELSIVSIIWGFSFGLIKNSLAGVNSNLVAFGRLFIALLVFLPFLRLRNVPRALAVRLALVGMVQYGIMYIAYIYAFNFLKSYEVALFTIFTPLYVTLTHDFIQKRFFKLHLAAALLAVAGTAIVQGVRLLHNDMLTGFLIVQVSNIAFAMGQVLYCHLMKGYPGVQDRQVFGLMYAGGALIAAAATLVSVDLRTVTLSGAQVLSLLYLGAVASGLCFFLWNFGARKVNAGALAVFNNLKIPAAVAISLLVFQEQANVPNLVLGGVIMLGALALNEWGGSRSILKTA